MGDLGGTVLNQLSMGNDRYPGFRVEVMNPNRASERGRMMNEWVGGETSEIPLPLTDFVQRIELAFNSGFENGDNPSYPTADITFRRNPDVGRFRDGWIADGVPVRIYQGDQRVRPSDWKCIFTGFFRGVPGNDPGTPASLSESFTAHAYGREERFLNSRISSQTFEAGTDVGVAAVAIAQRDMGLTQNEIRFGEQGYPLRHISNKIVDTPALTALWNLLFTAGKKPAFSGEGYLVAIDFDLDKPARRVYRNSDMIVALVAAPNDVEVNNRVTLTGLDSTMTKSVQEVQRLQKYAITTGFFQAFVDAQLYYSDDKSQRAEDTYVVPITRINWSEAAWTEIDEFHGRLTIDTHWLRNARAIIFGVYLALQLTIAILDLAMDAGGQTVANAPIPTPTGVSTVALYRSILQITAQLALAALIWAMNFIGHGEYEIWGRPFEFVYQQIVAEADRMNLAREETRTAEFRNDFLSKEEDLVERVRELLRRELVKDQLYQIDILDDLALGIDDVLETEDGDRFYIVSSSKTIERGADPVVSFQAWKIYAEIDLQPSGAQQGSGGLEGYGFNHGFDYGRGY